jgi:hypothetical protein
MCPTTYCLQHIPVSSTILYPHLFWIYTYSNFPCWHAAVISSCCFRCSHLCLSCNVKKRLKQLQYLTKRARYVETSVDPIVFKSVLVSNCAILLPFLTISSKWLRLLLSGYGFMVLNTTFNNYISVISW